MTRRGGGGGGSTLSSMTSRRRQLQQTRKDLSMDVERGGPQAPTRTQPQPVPPPQAPAQPSDGGRDGMLKKSADFIEGQRAQRQGAVPRTQQPAVQRVSVRPGPTTRLTERIDQLGAAERPLETQFFRLAGREGTPRELSIFRGRLELERQLNRPPTEKELMGWMMRPGSLGPLVNPAVEPTVPGAIPEAPATPREV